MSDTPISQTKPGTVSLRELAAAVTGVREAQVNTQRSAALCLDASGAPVAEPAPAASMPSDAFQSRVRPWLLGKRWHADRIEHVMARWQAV